MKSTQGGEPPSLLARPAEPPHREGQGFRFEIAVRIPESDARTGVVHTPHGLFQTPAFMPVGTQGTVKGLTPQDLESIGAEIILSNAYHLFIRPGSELIREAGGLHKFMGWRGPLLTDSGGYQVFSLSKLRSVTEEGVTFQSHFDGGEIFLTPERVIEIQEALGSDIAMVLDECSPYTQEKARIEASVELTAQWAKRSKACHRKEGQALFGIVQGGVFRDLREESLKRTAELDFHGYALGGIFVGEPKEASYEILDAIVPQMPAERPRYLMGAGTPLDLLECVARGMDLFDCVNPTRYGRNGSAFTSKGLVVVRNGKYNRDFKPIDEACRCYTCGNFSRSYLRHLFNCEEMLGPQLVSIHNVYFFLEFMKRIRREIEAGTFLEFKKEFKNQFDPNHR
jgi:queuine tRNA-ribosyltransferase